MSLLYDLKQKPNWAARMVSDQLPPTGELQHPLQSHSEAGLQKPSCLLAGPQGSSPRLHALSEVGPGHISVAILSANPQHSSLDPGNEGRIRCTQISHTESRANLFSCNPWAR